MIKSSFFEYWMRYLPQIVPMENTHRGTRGWQRNQIGVVTVVPVQNVDPFGSSPFPGTALKTFSRPFPGTTPFNVPRWGDNPRPTS